MGSTCLRLGMFSRHTENPPFSLEGRLLVQASRRRWADQLGGSRTAEAHPGST